MANAISFIMDYASDSLPLKRLGSLILLACGQRRGRHNTTKSLAPKSVTLAFSTKANS